MKKNSNHTAFQESEPAWDVARLFPAQGHWSETEYLDLDGNHLVELSQGRIEVLPMPTLSHQLLLFVLGELLKAFAKKGRLGVVATAPYRVRIRRGEFREPDILLALKEHAHLLGENFCKGADLVMEIVSPDAKSRRRDLKEKRRDYAKAGIPEYWIVDPRLEKITVLKLEGNSYAVHGDFSRGGKATSHLLPGFAVDVSAAFDSQNPDEIKSAKTKRRPKAWRLPGENHPLATERTATMKKNSNLTTLEEGEPAWDVARLFPPQGSWAVADYLDLDGHIPVEYSQGRIEVLPMPMLSHQRLLQFLYGLLSAFAVSRDLGEVFFAGLKVRILPKEFREPDLLFTFKEHADRMGQKFSKGADLVMEIVSPDARSRRRDLKEKRRDYAKAGIPEYWIVDPRLEKITVLKLDGKTYTVHGDFSRGGKATSHLLPGFAVDVSAAFDSQNPDEIKSAKTKRRPKA